MNSYRSKQIGADDCEYHIGIVDFSRDDLGMLVDAINYIRAHGITMFVGKYSDEEGSYKLPIGIRCLIGTSLNAKGAIMKILNSCHIMWKQISPSISSPDDLKIVMMIDAADSAGDISVDDITPPNCTDDPFEGLVGLDEEIALVHRLASAVKAYGRDSLESLHMVLMGNPGVGKTEFATRIARYFSQQGIISGGMHKVSAADLICDHVGSAPQLMRSAFDNARDGILFIDEAYSLHQGEGNKFGTEAINALVECLDSRRHEVIVIVAGYFNEMSDFLSANPGLRERFGFEMIIKDYSASQLGSIYRQFAKAKGFEIEDTLGDDTLTDVCREMMNTEGFSGARTIRKLFVASILSAAERHPETRTISMRDLNGATRKLSSRQVRHTICGFI